MNPVDDQDDTAKREDYSCTLYSIAELLLKGKIEERLDDLLIDCM